MHPITTVHYLALSAALLLIGTVGVLTRRNIVIILMSIELILNAVNINLIAFSHALQNVNGQIFAIFVITDAVAEAASRHRLFGAPDRCGQKASTRRGMEPADPVAAGEHHSDRHVVARHRAIQHRLAQAQRRIVEVR